MAKTGKTNDKNTAPSTPATAPTADVQTTPQLPPAPAGVAPEVWAAALAAAGKAPKAPRAGKVAAGIVELTIETAQALYTKGDWAAQIRAGAIGTVVILPTVDGGGVYTLAVVKDGKVNHVEPAHVDRVKSPRHLPRALRLAGTWLGANAGEEFSNGVKGGKGEKEVEEVEAPASTPEPTKTPAQKPARKGGKK